MYARIASRAHISATSAALQPAEQLLWMMVVFCGRNSEETSLMSFFGFIIVLMVVGAVTFTLGKAARPAQHDSRMILECLAFSLALHFDIKFINWMCLLLGTITVVIRVSLLVHWFAQLDDRFHVPEYVVASASHRGAFMVIWCITFLIHPVPFVVVLFMMLRGTVVWGVTRAVAERHVGKFLFLVILLVFTDFMLLEYSFLFVIALVISGVGRFILDDSLSLLFSKRATHSRTPKGFMLKLYDMHPLTAFQCHGGLIECLCVYLSVVTGIKLRVSLSVGGSREVNVTVEKPAAEDEDEYATLPPYVVQQLVKAAVLEGVCCPITYEPFTGRGYVMPCGHMFSVTDTSSTLRRVRNDMCHMCRTVGNPVYFNVA